MKYLLDTHVFLWWITDNPKLPRAVREIIEDQSNLLYFSTASIWEIMIKADLNKLQLPGNPREFIKEQLALNTIRIINITMDHAFGIYGLAEIHKDPFDRLLVAQAKVENLGIITADDFIRKYDVITYWT